MPRRALSDLSPRVYALFTWIALCLSGGLGLAHEALADEEPIQLEVRLHGKRFVQGEPIPFDLMFSSGDTQLGMVDHRSGRGAARQLETVVASSKIGWSKPRGRVYRRYQYTVPDDPAAAVIGDQILNDHIRFQEPGQYQVTVSSSRVEGHRVTSAPVKVRVRPTNERRQKRRFDALLEILDSSPHQVERDDAAWELAYLGTDQVVRELVTRLGTEPQSATGSAIVACRNRELAIALLEGAIADPARPISRELLRVLFELRGPHEPGTLERMVVEAIPGKDPAARALSVVEIGLPSWPSGRDLVDVIPELPPKEQLFALSVVDVGVSALQELLAIDDLDSSTRAQVLPLLLRADQQAGRTAILEEIRNPRMDGDWRFGGVLMMLSDERLEDLDDTMAANLEARPGSREFRLIERYATGAIAERVLRVLEAGGPGMNLASYSIGVEYLHRVDPDLASTFLSHFLTENEASFWHADLLRMLTRELWSPEVETICLEALSSTNPAVAAPAARALHDSGNIEVKEALLARLEVFHARWQDRDWTEEISEQWSLGSELDNIAILGLEAALWGALFHSDLWQLDPEEEARVAELVVSERGKAAVALARQR